MTGEHRRRRWRYLLIYGIAAGILVSGTQQAVRSLSSGEPWNWAEMGLVALGWPVLWTPAMWLLWRAVDRGQFPQSPARRDRDQRSTYISSAIAAGALPPDPNLAAWRRALREEGRESNVLRGVVAFFTGVGAVLIGAAAVVANDNAWGVWAVALVVAAEGLTAFLVHHRRLRQVRHLQALLPVT